MAEDLKFPKAMLERGHEARTEVAARIQKQILPKELPIILGWTSQPIWFRQPKSAVIVMILLK